MNERCSSGKNSANSFTRAAPFLLLLFLRSAPQGRDKKIFYFPQPKALREKRNYFIISPFPLPSRASRASKNILSFFVQQIFFFLHLFHLFSSFLFPSLCPIFLYLSPRKALKERKKKKNKKRQRKGKGNKIGLEMKREDSCI